MYPCTCTCTYTTCTNTPKWKEKELELFRRQRNGCQHSTWHTIMRTWILSPLLTYKLGQEERYEFGTSAGGKGIRWISRAQSPGSLAECKSSSFSERCHFENKCAWLDESRYLSLNLGTHAKVDRENWFHRIVLQSLHPRQGMNAHKHTSWNA